MRDGGLAPWLPQVAPAAARCGELAVALVSDRQMRSLNRRFRGVDRPTDVLSFPTRSGTPLVLGSGTPRVSGTKCPWRTRPHVWLRAGYSTPAFLGDIVIATGVARRQAREAGHSVQVELKRLALHGLLHVLGYDHERDTGQMYRLERRLRRKGGLPEE